MGRDALGDRRAPRHCRRERCSRADRSLPRRRAARSGGRRGARSVHAVRGHRAVAVLRAASAGSRRRVPVGRRRRRSSPAANARCPRVVRVDRRTGAGVARSRGTQWSGRGCASADGAVRVERSAHRASRGRGGAPGRWRPRRSGADASRSGGGLHVFGNGHWRCRHRRAVHCSSAGRRSQCRVLARPPSPSAR